VASETYNGSMSQDGSTTFGFNGGLTGTTPATPVVHCTGR
jgi:hypothetical protein